MGLHERNQDVRDGARLVLSGEVRKGYEKLLAAGLETIELGVRRGLRRGRLGAVIEESNASLDGTVVAFLKSKFPTERELSESTDERPRRFLKALVEATESPVGLLSKSAENFTIDRYRRLPEIPEALSVSIDADITAEGSGPAPDADPIRPEVDATLQRYQDVLAALPIDDRALVLLCCGAEELPLDVVHHVADQRGITQAAMLLEFSVRAARFATADEHEREACERSKERLFFCQEASARLQRWAQTDYLDVEDHGTTTLDAPRRKELLTRRGFRAATPGERRAIFLDLEAKQSRAAETLADCRRRLATPDPTRPDYEEVALLLGLLQPESAPAKRKRVINLITVRSRRLRERLAKAAIAIDREDEDV